MRQQMRDQCHPACSCPCTLQMMPPLLLRSLTGKRVQKCHQCHADSQLCKLNQFVTWSLSLSTLQQHCSQLWAMITYPINPTCLPGSISATPSTGIPAPVITGLWLTLRGVPHWHGTAWQSRPHGCPRITLPLCFVMSCQQVVTIQDCKWLT